MRLVKMIALAYAVTQSFSAFAADTANVKISLDVLKVGYGKESSDTVDTAPTNNEYYYSDILGSTAEESSTPMLELGIQYSDFVLYAYPFGNFGEREFWFGQYVDETFEWGLVAGGFSKSLKTPVTVSSGQKLQTDAFNKFGLFASFSGELLGSGFTASLVPYYGLGRTKYEQSQANEDSTISGLNGELIFSGDIAKNLSLGLGLSFDWNKTVKKLNGQEIRTDSSLDIGFHPARLSVRL